MTSEYTYELARVLVANAKNGHSDSMEFDDIASKLPDLSKSELEEACRHLERKNCVKIQAAQGKPVLAISLKNALFLEFDPVFSGNDPATDAASIAQELFERQGWVLAHDLEAAMGWPRRRFNPAFAMIVELLPPTAFRNPLQPDYPAIGVSVNPEVRAALRHLVE